MKKILAVALTLALTLTAFAACAESKETLTMATNASFPPYEYVEGDQVVAAFPNGNEAVMALVNGKIDCVIIDNEPAKAYVAANEGLKILDSTYVVEDYAACFAKDNTELVEKFNAALEELTADGTIPAIIEKYIPAE